MQKNEFEDDMKKIVKTVINTSQIAVLAYIICDTLSCHEDEYIFGHS